MPLLVSKQWESAPVFEVQYFVARGLDEEAIDRMEAHLDFDGTRYRAVALMSKEQVVLLFGYGEMKGTWMAFNATDDFLSHDYLAEKLQIREGDWPGAMTLFHGMFPSRVREWVDR
jgi:hypothetical protein